MSVVPTRPNRITLAAVNVATPELLPTTDGRAVYSGIAKQPLAAGSTRWLSLLNLAGDGRADLTVHGGVDKAVYAYPSEHLEQWRADLGETDLGPAPFGENLGTIGALEHEVAIGDRWTWGDAVLEVCQPRRPCFKLALHRRRGDVAAMLLRTGRCGWYLRVLEPGVVPVDGPVDVVAHDPAGLTVADAHSAMGDRRLEQRDLVERLVAHPALAQEWRRPLKARLEGR